MKLKFVLMKLVPSAIAAIIVCAATAIAATSTTNFTTARTFSWTAPPDVTSITVEAWGGGGAGGGAQRTNGSMISCAGGGGAGGAYASSTVLVISGTVYAVVVGAGGTGVSAANGNAGGDSSFNTSAVVAKGGGYGFAAVGTEGTFGAGGAATGGSTGTILNGGGNGAAGSTSGTGAGGGGGGGSGGSTGPGGNASRTTPGVAGSGGGGAGAPGSGTSGAGAAATAVGGGGAGAKSIGSAYAGGGGAAGQVRISYTVPNPTAPGTATATAAGRTSMIVTMPYGHDANANNTYTVEYRLSGSSTWTTWVAGAAHTVSPYTTTITGLSGGAAYDVRVTYDDADGVSGSNPQAISGVITRTIGTLDAWSNISSLAPNNASGTINVPGQTVSAESDKLMVVAVCMVASGTPATMSASATFGGRALTLIGSSSTTGREFCYLGYLKEANIPSGANTLSVSYACTGTGITITGLHIKWASYAGVDQTNPIYRSNVNYNTGTTVTFGAQIDHLSRGWTFYAAANGGSSATMTAPTDFSEVVSATAQSSGHSSFVAEAGSHPAPGSYASTTTVSFSGTATRSALVVASLTPVNRPPASGCHYLTTTSGTSLNISAATLASLDYDPDGDALAVASVSNTSTNGPANNVTFDGSTISYTPATGYVGADEFTYTISDNHGGSATCTAHVTVASSQMTSAFTYISSTNGGTVNLRGYGIPSRQYDIQYATSLDNPVWTFLTTVTAEPSGVILYTDTVPSGERYYRFAVH